MKAARRFLSGADQAPYALEIAAVLRGRRFSKKRDHLALALRGIEDISEFGDINGFAADHG